MATPKQSKIPAPPQPSPELHRVVATDLRNVEPRFASSVGLRRQQGAVTFDFMYEHSNEVQLVARIVLSDSVARRLEEILHLALREPREIVASDSGAARKALGEPTPKKTPRTRSK